MPVSSNPIIDQQAELLIKICKFVEWPFESAKNSFLLTFVGEQDSYDSIRDTLSTKKINGKPFSFSHIQTLNSSFQADILVIEQDAPNFTQETIQKVTSEPILTVSLLPSNTFPSIITFKDDGIKFEVNLPIAKKAGINIQFQLLQVADYIIR